MSNSIIIQPNDLGIRYLYCYHDSKGNIEKIINPESTFFLPITQELQERGSLAGFYDFSRIESSLQTIELLQTRPFSKHTLPFAICTRLPLTSITCNRQGDRYFSRIRFLDLLPNVISGLTANYLLIDREKETLLGFPPSFFDLYSKRFARGEEMLDLPVAEFLQPTPKEIQRKRTAVVDRQALLQAPLVYEKNFAVTSLGAEEELPVPVEIHSSDKGLHWSFPEHIAPGLDNIYITLLNNLNTYTEDFCLTAHFTNIRGTGPLLVLGGRTGKTESMPDDIGYLAGHHASRDSAIIKKTGFIVNSEPRSPLKQGEHSLSLMKSGNTLLLYEDDERIAGYFDTGFFHKTEAYVSLALRRGDSCVLRRLSLRKRRTSPSALLNRRAEMTAASSQPVQYFTLDPFFNTTLEYHLFNNISGYFLHDVTEFNSRIQSLDKRYKQQIRREEELKSLLEQAGGQEHRLIGSSPQAEKLRALSATVAASSATILIEGPTGSGKEVMARFLHALSSRKKGPFIKVDCATIPKGLIESHLFGHEKGAFTGAHAQAKGLFEQADRGTLFLDEVGNLPLDIQAKLLRFFNDFTITRVGGSAPLRLDVRCIAASNLPLGKLVSDGLFREDLYYRINAVMVALPPLAERKEDIPELSAHFLAQASAESGKRVSGFSREALAKLSGYRWPGNIRELRNTISRALLFCEEAQISEEDIQFAYAGDHGSAAGGRKAMPPFRLSKSDPKTIEEVLRQHNGKIVDAARAVGVTRPALYLYLKKHKIDLDSFRKGFSIEHQ